MAYADSKSNKNIDQLNSFLRGEISAVETYRIALQKLSFDSPTRGELEACRNSHERRVLALEHKIRLLGGEPSRGSGPWGAMVKAVEGAAKVLGDKLAISTLESGEDHGLNDYRADLDKLDGEALDLVTNDLLPRQEETHRLLSRLKRQTRI
jgi:hypothetical protein